MTYKKIISIFVFTGFAAFAGSLSAGTTLDCKSGCGQCPGLLTCESGTLEPAGILATLDPVCVNACRCKCK
ncbi:hypothetical protein Bealeia1_00437 [Candidatus Bealeia paramacronuclearis]|uniref:4Fe-4S ferredoxin-type domain-containing protein n=1 Tax=Candidatus Bealeia paramacronuclearis TaxID=1921001 RepID=A0ABZ2C180_9PROT|nr:hypothetical protein [Candidatus Bealeia paramacronuclearis]